MLFNYVVILLFKILSVATYSNILYTVTNLTRSYFDIKCANTMLDLKSNKQELDDDSSASWRASANNVKQKLVLGSYQKITTVKKDPLVDYEKTIHKFLFGYKVEGGEPDEYKQELEESSVAENIDHNLMHFPSGSIMRAEMFQNKSGVQFPPSEFMTLGYCKLNVTSDLMQTAVDAFAIFLEGTLDDVLRLPAEYVLNSARTIAMMKVAREKMMATWTVVKGDRKTVEIPFWTLEMYRPLFKYITAREIAKLNLNDTRILTFIGTHADLNRRQELVDVILVYGECRSNGNAALCLYAERFPARRQPNNASVIANEIIRLRNSNPPVPINRGGSQQLHVREEEQMGVVASRYMQINPQWMEAKYLNLMNNILCGVPMGFMRRISSNTYLQLTHQVFYHIRACDPLQRRFYLAMMTKTEALGKSYSWSARDVSRLGLLLAEVDGPDLGAINPEAMSGISAHVMLEIPAQSLQHITEVQLRYLGLKPLNILARKLKAYQDTVHISHLNNATFVHLSCYIVTMYLLILGIVN